MYCSASVQARASGSQSHDTRAALADDEDHQRQHDQLQQHVQRDLHQQRHAQQVEREDDALDEVGVVLDQPGGARGHLGHRGEDRQAREQPQHVAETFAARGAPPQRAWNTPRKTSV